MLPCLHFHTDRDKDGVWSIIMFSHRQWIIMKNNTPISYQTNVTMLSNTSNDRFYSDKVTETDTVHRYTSEQYRTRILMCLHTCTHIHTHTHVYRQEGKLLPTCFRTWRRRLCLCFVRIGHSGHWNWASFPHSTRKWRSRLSRQR